MLIIGESINGTIEEVAQAILDRNGTYIGKLARTQYGCGAQMLDVHAGVAGGKEIADLPWLIEVVQKEVSIPLMIDSGNPEALKAALSVYRHKDPPIINSIAGEEQKWEELGSVITDKKTKVVVLCLDDHGIPRTREERMGIASRIFYRLREADIPPDHIYFDPLVLSVAVDPAAANVTLETIRELRRTFPGTHTICGISNVSMGLPGRKLINRTFLAIAMFSGLDTLLIDVRDQTLLSLVYACKILANLDPYCLEYLQAFREKKILI
jgi:cobalamin-dependent methionine synthase I